MYEDRVGVFLLISLCRVCSYLSKSHWYSWLFVIANIWSKPTWRSVQIDQNSELSVELGWSSQKLTKLTVHKLYQLFYRIKWLILNWNIFTLFADCFFWMFLRNLDVKRPINTNFSFLQSKWFWFLDMHLLFSQRRVKLKIFFYQLRPTYKFLFCVCLYCSCRSKPIYPGEEVELDDSFYDDLIWVLANRILSSILNIKHYEVTSFVISALDIFWF